MTRLIASALALLWLGLTSSVSAAPPRHVVVIVADDFGWTDLGCQGSTFYETPHLDRLAAEGMRFTDAYAACPVCSPTRASYLTGKTPARLRMTEYIPGRALPHAAIVPPPSLQELPHEEITLAERLAAAGYTTAHVGKWHLGSRQFEPRKQGFEINIGGSHLGLPQTYFAPYRLPNLTEGPQGEHLTDRLGAEAAGLVEQHHERPLFLSLCFYAVHTPIQGKPAYVAKYKQKLKSDSSQTNPAYAAMVQSLDEAVGQVLTKLEQLGIADETLVIFTSDNGGSHEGTSNRPLREGKGHLYEGGIRVPLLVRWPGVVPAGSTCSTPVSTIDLLPTILDAVETAPEPAAKGLSLLPLLKKPDAKLAREALHWYYPHYSPQGGRPGGAIRRGNLKLIEFYDTGETELYDLSRDVSESQNLAAKQPADVERLQSELHAWLAHVEALPYSPNPDYDPANPRRGAYFRKWKP